MEKSYFFFNLNFYFVDGPFQKHKLKIRGRLRPKITLTE
jgi:hypothetical protein